MSSCALLWAVLLEALLAPCAGALNPTPAPTIMWEAFYVDKVESVYANGSLSPRQLYGPMEGNSLTKVNIGSATATHSQTFEGMTFQCKFTGSARVPGTVGYEEYSRTTPAHLQDGALLCRTPRFNATTAKFTVMVDGVEQAGRQRSFDYQFFPTILVSDMKRHSVRRFVATTGEYWDELVSPNSQLEGPRGLAFGPDQDLYVASEQTDSVLLFNGTTGAFIRTVCKDIPTPRSVVFHYRDLFVVSRGDHSVYRIRTDGDLTGTTKHVYVIGDSGNMLQPWGLVFDKATHTAFVSSEHSGTIFAYRPPTGATWAVDKAVHSKVCSVYDKVWSNTRVTSASGMAFTVDSVYVTGPDAGRAVVRFNRTTGEYMHHFQDDLLARPTDINEYNDYVYVLDEDKIIKYNRLNGERIRVHSKLTGMVGSNFNFHRSWSHDKGE